jgi:two-component sensor histidine kinase
MWIDLSGPVAHDPNPKPNCCSCCRAPPRFSRRFLIWSPVNVRAYNYGIWVGYVAVRTRQTRKQNNRRSRPRLRTENTTLREKLRLAGVEAAEDERRSAAKNEAQAQALTVANEATRPAKLDADEIRHRLKNIIAVILAIANATLLDDIPMQTARVAFQDRLAALGATHDILVDAGWESASIPQIIRGVLAPYQSSRVRTRGPDIAIDPKPALAFALALHELASNASKYGALSMGRGYLDIVWTAKPAPKARELQLRWRECGGPTVSNPVHEGFGTRLIKTNLARVFNGTVKLDFRSSGVVCTLVAPLPTM